MTQRPDYILDLSSANVSGQTDSQRSPQSNADASAQGRPWIAVQWKCCHTYSRIYRNKQATAYEGRCPKCGKPVRASVGQGGTNNRFFTAE